MQHHRKTIILGAASILVLAALGAPIGAEPQRTRPPVGVVVDLNEDFYRALQEGRREGTKTYATGADSEEYLRQIAVATRYIVESNLAVLRQQERIIELLEAIRDRPPAKP
jgi:hypothetical protein